MVKFEFNENENLPYKVYCVDVKDLYIKCIGAFPDKDSAFSFAETINNTQFDIYGDRPAFVINSKLLFYAV